MLDEFRNSYYNINDRQPFDEEILENMEVNIPNKILLSLMEQRKQNMANESHDDDGEYNEENAFRKPKKSKTMNDI